ncbi:MAG: hypothetical protein D6683_13815, partial [Actinomyces sp.]
GAVLYGVWPASVSPRRPGGDRSRPAPAHRRAGSARVLVARLGAPATRLAPTLGVAPGTLVAAVAGGLVLALAAPLLAPVPLLAVGGLVAARRRREVADRRRLIEFLFPDVVDLLTLAVAAGATPRQALAGVGPRLPAPFDITFAELGRRLDAGETFARALDVLVDELGDPLRPLVTTLVAADHDGAPVLAGLERVGDEARRRRRVRAEEAARRVPVRMLFPLVACILPAFVALTLVPLLYGSLRSLSLG